MTDAGPSLRGAVDLSSLRNRPSAPPAGEATAAGIDLVFDATDDSFAQVVELSRQVPVVVDLWAEWCGPCKQLGPAIEKVIREQDGRVVLAKVDVDANPGLAQAFRAQSIPMVVALVAGQPVPLFTGAVPEAQVREVVAQLLQLAAQNGVSGRIESTSGEQDGTVPPEPAVPPLAPLHQEAYDAIERGDYAAAEDAYRRALKENPRDAEAEAGLGQVTLLGRVTAMDPVAVREKAAAAPDDIEAQLDVADLDLSGGHVEDAFDRLLSLFSRLDAETRRPVQTRLVELFAVIGAQDPRVTAARTRLSSLLF